MFGCNVALIVGDDWGYPDVRRAAAEVAASAGRFICVEGGTCWTYAPLSPAQKDAGRALHLSAKDLLWYNKNKSDMEEQPIIGITHHVVPNRKNPAVLYDYATVALVLLGVVASVGWAFSRSRRK